MDYEEEDANHLETVGTYKHGSIGRVKLTNFLTYQDAEVVPGPRLNMVIGPNGTGKSTILCAICLGLGGEPKLLGRASDIETFVANGEDEGEIEIEIVTTVPGEENPVIVRKIRRHGKPKSSFFWNGQPIQGKAVREICLKDYHISVDNLCTFLPQDRVGSFSGFDSKQLLLETEKSLSASQNLYHTHQELIKDQAELRGGDHEKDTLEEKYKHLQNEFRRLERAKTLMEERDLAAKQAELLRKKIIWLKFDNLITETNDKRALRAELKDKLRQLSGEVRPMEELVNDAKEKVQRLDKETVTHDKDVRKHRKEMEKQTKKYEAHDDQIESIIQELNALDSQRAMKQRKAEELREKVEQKREELSRYPSMETLKEEAEQCVNDQKAILPKYDATKREHSNLENQRREIEDEYRQSEVRLRKLQDEKARRKERIFRQQPNLKRISDWLQNNRTQFRKEVMGPVMCEITCQSAKTAAYLEQHVPNATLKSFVVQSKEDYDLLYKSVRQGLGVPINISLVNRINPTVRAYSDHKMQTLRNEHGVLGYMDETFTAPDLIVQALKNASSIDKVLIGTEKTQQSLDNRDLLNYLSQPERGDKLMSCCIFSSDGAKSYKYTSTISSYSGKPSTRVDDIRPAKFLAPGVSDDAKERVQQEFDVIDKRRKDILPEVEACKKKLADIQRQAQETREKMKNAKEQVKELERQRLRLSNAESKLEAAEAELAVDDLEEKNQRVASLNKRIHHSMLALEAHGESYKKMMNATIQHTGARLNKEIAAVEESKHSMKLEEIMREYRQIEAEFKDAGEAYKRAKTEVHRMKEIADREAPLEDDEGNDLPLKAALDELPVETLEEAEVALEEAENRLDSIVDDKNAIRQYEEVQIEMEGVKAELDDLKNFEDRRKDEMEQKVKPWEDALANAVAKVDARFSTYMAELGCTGQVGLTKGEPTEDNPNGNFKDWGIEIRVSFREGTKPQVLSARVQSGGERSVSTIMYLMALQDMMVSPFRCVDEINQGLDERNERLVFKRIVSNSTRVPGKAGPTDHSGQYFLITPKLLPNLYDMEVEAMTVLFIFNGAYNLKDPQDWDISRLLGLRQRALPGTEADDDEENTPNSQSRASGPPSKRRRKTLTNKDTEDIDI